MSQKSPDITSEGLPTARSSDVALRGHGGTARNGFRAVRLLGLLPPPAMQCRGGELPHTSIFPPSPPPPPNPPTPFPFGSREPELALTLRCAGGRRRLTDAAGGFGKGRTRRCQLGLKRAACCGGVGGWGGLYRREGSAERGALTWHGSRFLLHNATPRGLRWGEWGVGGWGSPVPPPRVFYLLNRTPRLLFTGHRLDARHPDRAPPQSAPGAEMCEEERPFLNALQNLSLQGAGKKRLHHN